MKPSTVASKTMSIKARVYNQIRKDLFKEQATKNDDGTIVPFMTIEDKEKLFNKWFILNKEAHLELNAYKRKRQEAKSIHEQRLKNGWYEKIWMKHFNHNKKMINEGNPKNKGKKVI